MKLLGVLLIGFGVLTAIGTLVAGTVLLMSLETALFIWFWVGFFAVVIGGMILDQAKWAERWSDRR